MSKKGVHFRFSQVVKKLGMAAGSDRSPLFIESRQNEEWAPKVPRVK
ncbi:MAG: hypothetical protein ICV79_29000 [Flavisolibacter sp.]|nr:hypothetical protein [Flavisolibacter sp.]